MFFLKCLKSFFHYFPSLSLSLSPSLAGDGSTSLSFTILYGGLRDKNEQSKNRRPRNVSDSFRSSKTILITQKERGKMGAETTEVLLNVYDLTPINNYSYWFGVGIFHSGIEGFETFLISCSLLLGFLFVF